jgi:hypothetical protein
MFLLSKTVQVEKSSTNSAFPLKFCHFCRTRSTDKLAFSSERMDTSVACVASTFVHCPAFIHLTRSHPMPNDAKLGFVVGLAVVITVSAVFYRKAGTSVPSLAEEVKAAAVPSRRPVQIESGQPVKARPAVRNKSETPEDSATSAQTGHANIGLYLDGELPEQGSPDQK